MYVGHYRGSQRGLKVKGQGQDVVGLTLILDWRQFLPMRHYVSVGVRYGNSICLCVSHMLCIKTTKRFVKILLPPDSPSFKFFVTEGRCFTLTASSLTGCHTQGGEKIGQFFTDESVYLRNGARYGHSCYRSQIGNHTQAIEWCHFRWPWATQNPSFKVTLQFKGEYIANSACYGHSYYTHTQPFYSPLGLSPGLHGWAGTRMFKQDFGKTSLDLLEQKIVSGSGISLAICKSAPWPRNITTPASHHSVFTVRCTTMQSTVMRSHVCLSVCNVGGSWPQVENLGN